MAISGTFPAQGVRVALDLESPPGAVARYVGAAFTPTARFAVTVSIDVATGVATLEVGDVTPRDEATPAAPLDPADAAFVRQLGHQLWRQATQLDADRGGGAWARRVQRWRGPK